MGNNLHFHVFFGFQYIFRNSRYSQFPNKKRRGISTIRDVLESTQPDSESTPILLATIFLTSPGSSTLRSLANYDSSVLTSGQFRLRTFECNISHKWFYTTFPIYLTKVVIFRIQFPPPHPVSFATCE